MAASKGLRGNYYPHFIPDGDTIYAQLPQEGNPGVRFTGFDAPERDQPGGIPAQRFLQESIGNNPVAINSTGLDHSGKRYMAQPQVNGQDLGLRMIQKGHGYATGWKDEKPPESYIEAEKEAREGYRGVHGVVNAIAPGQWRSQKKYMSAKDKVLPEDYRERMRRIDDWADLNITNPYKSKHGDFGAGIARGVDHMQGDLYGLLHMAGNMTDSDTLRKWGVEGYKRNQREAMTNPAEGGAKGLRKVDGPGEFIDWLQAKAGESLPFMASMVGGGGIGGLAAKGAAKRAASKLGRELAAAELKKQTMKGAAGGAFAAGYPSHTGATYEDIYQGSGIHAPGTAIVAGATKSALDVAGGGAMLSPFLRETKRQGLRAVLSGAGRGFLGEGLTEMAQEATDIGARELVDPNNYNAMSDDNAWRLAEAGLAGGLLGGGIGGIGGAANMAQDQVQAPAQDQTREQTSPQQELLAPPQVNTSEEEFNQQVAESQALENTIARGELTPEATQTSSARQRQQERIAQRDKLRQVRQTQYDEMNTALGQSENMAWDGQTQQTNNAFINKSLNEIYGAPKTKGDRQFRNRMVQRAQKNYPGFTGFVQQKRAEQKADWAKDDRSHLRNRKLVAQSQQVAMDQKLLAQREKEHEGIDAKRFKEKLEQKAGEKRQRLFANTQQQSNITEEQELTEETEHGVVEEEHNPAINVTEREEGKTFEAEFTDTKNKPYTMGVVEGRVFKNPKATPTHGMELTEKHAPYLQPPMRKAYDRAVQYNKDTYDNKGLITLRKDKNNNYSVEVSQYEEAKDALPPLKEENKALIKERIEGAKRVAANKFQGALLFKNPDGKKQLMNLHELVGLGFKLAPEKQGTNEDTQTVSDLHALQAGLAAAELEGYSLQHGGKDIKTIGDLEKAFQFAMTNVAGYKEQIGNRGGASYARSAAQEGLDYWKNKSIKGLSERSGKIPHNENIRALQKDINDVRKKVKAFNDAHAQNNIGVVKALNGAAREVMSKEFDTQEDMKAALLKLVTQDKKNPLLSTQQPVQKPKKFKSKEQIEAAHAAEFAQTGKIKKEFKPKSPAEQWAFDVAKALTAQKKIESAYAR